MWSVAVYVNLISACLQLHGQHVQINEINKALGTDLSDRFLQNAVSRGTIVHVCTAWLAKVSDPRKFNTTPLVHGAKKYSCFYKKKFLIFGMMTRETHSSVNESE